jgi:hypothetical protein
MVAVFSVRTPNTAFFRVDFFMPDDYPDRPYFSFRAPITVLLRDVIVYIKNKKLPIRLVFEKGFPKIERELVTQVIELYNIAKPLLY